MSRGSVHTVMTALRGALDVFLQMIRAPSEKGMYQRSNTVPPRRDETSDVVSSHWRDTPTSMLTGHRTDGSLLPSQYASSQSPARPFGEGDSN